MYIVHSCCTYYYIYAAAAGDRNIGGERGSSFE